LSEGEVAHTLTTMRRLIVQILLRACETQDLLRLDYLTHSHRLADWSARLDERWDTGIWKESPGACPALTYDHVAAPDLETGGRPAQQEKQP
jgi:hypothetical protein